MARDANTAAFVLLDDCRPKGEAGQSLLFQNPHHIIVAHTVEEVGPALTAMDQALRDGYHLAGWISFEAAAYFEPKLAPVLSPSASEPLVWLIAVQKPEIVTPDEVNAFLACEDKTTLVFDETTAHHDYVDAMAHIQKYIAAGDVYQVNHTFPLSFTLQGSQAKLYKKMRRSQPVAFGAFIDTGDQQVLSLSPELFFKKQGNSITTRPMKGTAPKSHDEEKNKVAIAALQSDEKNRAENLMIVDLLRNDLSRIAKGGSVKVEALFAVEEYETLLQMTSTISATVADNITASEILAALFPCGSVTGAPKIRAIEIISALEKTPRGIYCGAIGHFQPNGDITLNVPIRTAIINNAGQGRLNIGSGVVADSRVEDEYKECLLKGRFLTHINPPYDLLETLLWQPDVGFQRIEQHLSRLAKSADSFLRPFNRVAVMENLKSSVQGCKAAQRVRLTLAPNGTMDITTQRWSSKPPENATICFSQKTTHSHDPMLGYKTSHRDLYDAERDAAVAEHGVTDVIFCNEHGDITEGAISNIFVKIGDTLFTPPLTCGLLPGIMRADVLSDSTIKTGEKNLTHDMVVDADTIYITNSLRGLLPVTLLSA